MVTKYKKIESKRFKEETERKIKQKESNVIIFDLHIMEISKIEEMNKLLKKKINVVLNINDI